MNEMIDRLVSRTFAGAAILFYCAFLLIALFLLFAAGGLVLDQVNGVSYSGIGEIVVFLIPIYLFGIAHSCDRLAQLARKA